MTEDDVKQLESLNWLHSTTEGESGLDTLIKYYNELGRKFLFEGKFKPCANIVERYFLARLTTQQRTIIANLDLVTPVTSNMNRTTIKLVAYERERQNIVKLSKVLETQ
jgi:hypothetical protein